MRYPESQERLETEKGKTEMYLTVRSVLELIKRIIDEENLELDLTDQGIEGLLSFLNNPEEYVEDAGICEKVRALNELLAMLGEGGVTLGIR